MWKILDQLGLFFVNLFNAVKFSVLDYDSKLRLRKTPKQRFWIWTAVGILTVLAIASFLFIIGSFTKRFLNK